jgi:hypothetical protein
MRRGDPSPPMARGPAQTAPRRRYERAVAPHDKDFEPGLPTGQNARYGEDTRLYRRLRVTDS